MRLAVVVSHPIQYYTPLFRALAKRVDLHVFFSHRASPGDQAGAGYGVAFEWDIDLLSGYEHEFLVNVAARPGISSFSGSDTPEIYDRLRVGRYDAVLVMGWYLKSMWQAIWAAKRLGIPVLVRGDSQLGSRRSLAKAIAKRLIFPIALRIFDAALYVGLKSKEYYQFYGYPEKRLFFSPHCVDASWFAERATLDAGNRLRQHLGINSDEVVVLLAGRLVEMKRPLDVIAAAGRLKQLGNPVSVVVAGSGLLEKEIEQRAKVEGVCVHLLGFRNQTEMPAVYAAADVLVLPSDGNETWGLVVNESLACGTPVVVSNEVGCAPDLAADGLAGCTYPMGDCDALAAAISRIVSAPPLPSVIADKSQAFSIEAACNGIVIALDELQKLR